MQFVMNYFVARRLDVLLPRNVPHTGVHYPLSLLITVRQQAGRETDNRSDR